MYVGHSPEYECMLRFRECEARRDRVCRTIVRNTNVCCNFESAQHAEIVYVRKHRGQQNGRRKKEGKTGDSTGIRPFR